MAVIYEKKETLILLRFMAIVFEVSFYADIYGDGLSLKELKDRMMYDRWKWKS